MDGHPLIPLSLQDIYMSCLAQVTNPDDQKCLENLAFEVIKIDPDFLSIVKKMSEIQFLYTATEPMVLSRNMLMAYITYRLTRLKMLNSLIPSLN